MKSLISFEDFIPTSITIGPDGIARSKARIARAGTQKYAASQIFGDGEGGGWVNVLRPPDKIKKTANLFSNMPISIEHEDINSSNKEQALKGIIGACRFDDETHWIIADVNITADDAIETINNGTFYFSAAYDAEIVRQSGVWIDEKGVQGEVGATYKYDAIQIPTRAIHVSLVRRPRAGTKATFTDSTGNSIAKDFVSIEKNHPRGGGMPTMNYEEYKDKCGQLDMIEVELGDGTYKLPDPDKMKKKMTDSAAIPADAVAFETFKDIEYKYQQAQRGLKDSMQKISLLEREIEKAKDVEYQQKIYTAKVAAWEDVREIFTDSMGGVDPSAPEFNPKLEAHEYYKMGLEACGVTVPDGLDSQGLKDRWEWSKSFLTLGASPSFTDSAPPRDPIAKIRSTGTGVRNARKMTDLMTPSHLAR